MTHYTHLDIAHYSLHNNSDMLHNLNWDDIYVYSLDNLCNKYFHNLDGNLFYTHLYN